jgi:prepilin peptidase CpaA
MNILPYSVFIFLAIMLALAAYSDLRSMIIPNWISLVVFAGFFPAALMFGFTQELWLEHLLIGCVAFIVFVSLFFLGVFGGGDAKLMSALAFWIDLKQLILFLLLVSVSGAIIGLSKMAVILVRDLKSGTPLTRQRLTKAEIPYGVAIAIGALLTLPETGWMKGQGIIWY